MTEQYEFDPVAKEGVYKAIFERRDMRHFRKDPVSEVVVEKLLRAAHSAPSVGLMQPWRVVRLQAAVVRQSLHAVVEKERLKTAEAMGERSDEFMQLKVQGILDCGEVWVITLMEQRERHIFGRRTLPHMDLASASCAIQNIWLAARAEGLGMGWVSIFDPQDVCDLLGIPVGAEPIGILCLGHVDEFYDQPMLAKEGWAQRGDLKDYVMTDGWELDKAARAQQQWDKEQS